MITSLLNLVHYCKKSEEIYADGVHKYILCNYLNFLVISYVTGQKYLIFYFSTVFVSPSEWDTNFSTTQTKLVK